MVELPPIELLRSSKTCRQRNTQAVANRCLKAGHAPVANITLCPTTRAPINLFILARWHHRNWLIGAGIRRAHRSELASQSWHRGTGIALRATGIAELASDLGPELGPELASHRSDRDDAVCSPDALPTKSCARGSLCIIHDTSDLIGAVADGGTMRIFSYLFVHGDSPESVGVSVAG